MMGMSQIKKKTMQGIAIGASVGIVGIGITLWWSISTINSYKAGTNKEFNAKYNKDVVVLTKEVIQGEVIDESMITTVNVHSKTVPRGALASNEIAGKVAKYNIAANVPITESMVTTEIIDADIRSQEINTVVMPSDLNEGEYIDIRIMYPNGTDYIVLAQKKVKTIEGQTMWLNLAEDERLLLNSAIVDSFLNSGTKLYATKYADSDSQIKLASNVVLKAVDEEDDEDTDTDTDTKKVTTEMNKTLTASDNAASVIQGKMTSIIKSELDLITSDDSEKAVDAIFDLILKYKSFASAVTRTTENYQPNNQVMAMMQANKNILDEAKEKLSAEARSNIENGINNYKSNSGEDYQNVVSGAKESITNQKTLRNELLNPVMTPATTTEE